MKYNTFIIITIAILNAVIRLMTPRTETRIYGSIYNYDNNNNNYYKNNIVRNIINNSSTILQAFKDKYNTLSNEVKELYDFSDNLQRTICSLQNTVSKLKHDYNGVQTELNEYKEKLACAENRVQLVSETSLTSDSHSDESSDNICVICMSNPRECVYTNCGHHCACLECCEQMDLQCPICRQTGNFIKLISV